MHVKIETACHWEGKRYESGSVIEVPEDIVNKNAFMKPTDAALFEAPEPKPVPAAPASVKVN